MSSNAMLKYHVPMLRTGLALSFPLISCLLLAAHYLRFGAMGPTLFWLLAPSLLLVRRAWVKPVMQVLLAAGMIVWVLTLIDLVHLRQMLGLPWLRMSLIVGGVALFTAASVLVFETDTLRARFSRDQQNALVQTGAFLLTLLTLGLLQHKLSFPILLADRFFDGLGYPQALLTAFYAAWISGKLLDPVRAPAVRARMWLFFSAVFFAQFGLGLAGWEQFLMTGKLHLPVPALVLAGPIYRGEGFFMLMLFLGTVLLVGPAWCSHLCYIGAWDHQAARSRARPSTLPAWTPVARLTIFILVMATALGLHLLDVHWSWAATLAAGFGLAGVGIMVAISRQKGVMAHCTVYCPLGLAAVVLGKFLPWRLAIASDCDACGRCSQACRYQALEPDDLLRKRAGLSCTLCGDCISRCRNNRLAYQFPLLSPAAARRLFILLIASLHAVFLATARI